MHLVRQIGGITVRGNHDEVALERYEMWKKCGRLDVGAGSLGPTLAGSQPLQTSQALPMFLSQKLLILAFVDDIIGASRQSIKDQAMPRG